MDRSFQYFNIERQDYISRVSINRPDKSNAFNEKTWEELRELMDFLSDDDETRVVILMGEGRNFSAGMDLATLMSIPQRWASDCEARKREAIIGFIHKIQDCITAIERCSVPVIAAVHGACIGGAMSVITACDIRYSTAEAYFSIRETDLGIVADIGVLQRMSKITEPGILAELSYTARNFSGKEAEKIGLVSKVWDTPSQMMDGAEELARQIAAKSPLVIRGTKKMLLYSRDHSTQDALEKVAGYNAAMLLSRDLVEAMSAYMEKRTPRF